VAIVIVFVLFVIVINGGLRDSRIARRRIRAEVVLRAMVLQKAVASKKMTAQDRV
jgi:hypothetical protein